ncbi:hypothetical protein [Proteus mirabilis]|uniref:hypothetical protein n=1 Tax=Proteus mirabilis TaxID=584 RepID=UPI001FD8136E|nr:hypothetical protein [Proteus mirabilis]
MENDDKLNEKIEQRKKMLKRVKEGLVERLNLNKSINQIDDDTPLFGSGLKLLLSENNRMLVISMVSPG